MPTRPDRPSGPVLVAIDFSPFSENALVWGGYAARSFDARLVALHVVHDPGSAPGYYERAKKRKKHLVRIEEAASEMMSEFLEEMREKHPELPKKLEHRLVVGLPITRILEVADDIGAQLIVMGSRGRTGLPFALLGSKAEKVAQLSSVPVTIVKNSGQGE
ncbi:MAG: universal stress protein [Thermoanaerobaculia bacterium]